MPLARYFLLVGGALLAVLLVAGALLPPLPVVDHADSQRTTIRIHSEMKLPERVVFDTSTAAVVHPAAPVTAAIGVPAPPFASDVSAKTREAFAQLGKAKVGELKRPESKSSPPRTHETRKRAAAPRKIRLARQPQFDWFGGGMWW